MILTFADEGARDIYVGADSKAARHVLPKPLWSMARRKMHWIDAARDLVALRVPPGNRLEPLKGVRSGSCSVRVNDQSRITFRFEQGNAYEVCCEDYH